MQKYKSNIATTSGAALRGIQVHVLSEAGIPASLFLDRLGAIPASNPLITGADGTFYFYAANGRYSLRTTVEGASITDSDVVLLMDPEEITVAGPIADAIQRAEAAAQLAQETLEDSGIPDLVAAAQNAVADAGQAVGQAQEAKTQAEASAQAAGAAKDVAEGAVGVAGAALAAAQQAAVKYERALLKFADLAAAVAAAASLPDGQRVDVESEKKRYRVEAGALVFVDLLANLVTLEALNSFSTYTGGSAVANVSGPEGGIFYHDESAPSASTNGVTVVADAVGRRWRRLRQGPIQGEALGIFSGKDCTLGLIKAFEIAANDGVAIDLPHGVLRFDTGILVPPIPNAGKKARVRGQGKYNTVLEYTGSDRGATLIKQVGTVGTGGGYFELSGVGLAAAQAMTGGAAIHFQMAGFNNLDDIAFGRQYGGTPKLWDGIVYDETDMQTLCDFEIIVQNAGIVAAGKGVGNVGRPQYDVFATRGKIAGCKIGVNIAGGFDNGYFDHIMCTSNQENVLIDNSRYAFPNQNVAFGPSFVNEHASVAGLRINDTQAALPSSHIAVYGHIQSNAKGVVVESSPNGNLEIFSPHISSNAGDAFLIADASTRITLSEATKIHSNGGYGINAPSGAKINRPLVMYGNAAGDIGGTITGYKQHANGFVTSSILSVDARGNNAATAHLVAAQKVILAAGSTGQGVKITSAVGETVTVINITGADFVVYPEDGSTFAGATSDTLQSGHARSYLRAGPGTWVKEGSYRPG